MITAPEAIADESLAADGLACPRCDTPLRTADVGLACPACQIDFPQLDGVPFLFAEPRAALGEWRSRLNLEFQRLNQDARQLGDALQAHDLHPLTRQRLQMLQDASRQHRLSLEELMAPLIGEPTRTGLETYLALRTRLPSDQGLNTYYNNIHRDWAWGDEENRRACELVASMLGDPARGSRVLILGAGGCRLAYDLHMNRDHERTVALDFNPLLLLLAARLIRGERIQLHEFPIAPRNIESGAVLRELAAPAPARDGLELILGDALRPPFPAGSFDAVVTPWLVDILPMDFKDLALRINTLLKPGGRWVNFGSLVFTHADAKLRYSLEETLQLVEDAGFGPADCREDEIPYMCSPASRHQRQERMVSFAATKQQDTPPQPRHSALPEWLVTGQEPVPVLPSFQMQAASTRIYAFVMGMIDGRRSIRDMAEQMEKQRLMTRDEAEPAIRSFLIKMHEDSQRGLLR